MDGRFALEYVLKNNIEGALVECGVESGNFEAEWISVLQQRGKVRDIYLYDTFAGLTRPGEFDYTRPDAVICHASQADVLNEWESKFVTPELNTWCYTPLDVVRNRLESTGYPRDRLRYVVGDVMKTLADPKNIPESIAILRLDTDWYQSSKYELEQLYSKVPKGGVVIFDDYYHWDGQRRATDEFFAEIGESPIIIPTGNRKTGAFVK
jgi:O-methyltransferase